MQLAENNQVSNRTRAQGKSLNEYQCAVSQLLSDERLAQQNGQSESRANGGSLSPRFVSLSLGKTERPVVTAIVRSVQDNIGGQIAAKMGYDAVIQDLLRVSDEFSTSIRYQRSAPAIIEDVIQTANRNIYHYGHRMTGAGRMFAQALVAIYDGDRMSIGSVGAFDCLLWRDRKLIRFYGQTGESTRRLSRGETDYFVGVNERATVEHASVRVKDSDVVLVGSFLPDNKYLSFVDTVLRSSVSLDDSCRRLVSHARDLFRGRDEAVSANRNPVIWLLHIGPPTITLVHLAADDE